MQNRNNPCKGCADRTLGCHASCEKYKIFKAELDVMAENAKKIYMNWKTYSEYPQPRRNSDV